MEVEMSALAIITGIVGADPQCQEISKSGSTEKTKALTFPLITFERVFNSVAGAFSTKSVRHRCVAYGRTAEMIERFFQKGKGIQVTGGISYRTWNNGSHDIKITEIIVDKFFFTSAEADGEVGQSKPSETPAPQQQASGQQQAKPTATPAAIPMAPGYHISTYTVAAAKQLEKAATPSAVPAPLFAVNNESTPTSQKAKPAEDAMGMDNIPVLEEPF
ncbi:MAG: single-stranded DNA-binding protein [Acidithiobacillus ferrivorans]